MKALRTRVLSNGGLKPVSVGNLLIISATSFQFIKLSIHPSSVGIDADYVAGESRWSSGILTSFSQSHRRLHSVSERWLSCPLSSPLNDFLEPSELRWSRLFLLLHLRQTVADVLSRSLREASHQIPKHRGDQTLCLIGPLRKSKFERILAVKRLLSTSTGPSSSTQKRYFYMYCASAGMTVPATPLVVAASKDLEVIGKGVCALLVSAKHGLLG